MWIPVLPSRLQQYRLLGASPWLRTKPMGSPGIDFRFASAPKEAAAQLASVVLCLGDGRLSDANDEAFGARDFCFFFFFFFVDPGGVGVV